MEWRLGFSAEGFSQTFRRQENHGSKERERERERKCIKNGRKEGVRTDN